MDEGDLLGFIVNPVKVGCGYHMNLPLLAVASDGSKFPASIWEDGLPIDWKRSLS